MSLPPNTGPPNQLEPTYSPRQNVMTTTTSSEEEIAPNQQKSKKKGHGVMGFFKRNK
jgi:hypothetical protein